MQLALKILLLGSLLVQLSCKYEKGPVISFVSRDKRIQRSWNLSERVINGNIYNNNYKEELIFGEFSSAKTIFTLETGEITEFIGGWNFLNNDNSVTFNKYRSYSDSSGGMVEEVYTVIAKIKRLSKNEFWIEYTDTKGNKFEDKYSS